MSKLTVVGAGLAGCEAAWQLAHLGHTVQLIEMKPKRRTPAQVSDKLAELVCSNSLRSTNLVNAVGLLKHEMRELNSLIIRAADAARVPAGDALAVDREVFSGTITEHLENQPNVTLVSDIVTKLPDSETIVATGPLTEEELAEDIRKHADTDSFYFYDAIAPIVDATSLDRNIIFAESRYGKGEGSDYLNCPLNQEEYDTFYDALMQAEQVPFHDFEKPKYFAGCMPIEVTAASGKDALRFGAMKPVGLTDPRTGKRPYAVVQLRMEDAAGQAYNLVGFQTKLKYGEQSRVFRMIPGLAKAEFLRLGAIHRNSYLNSPTLLDERMRFIHKPNVRFAGQMTGVEGYVESAAHGLLTAKLFDNGFSVPPPTTALGALYLHVRGAVRANPDKFEPQNVNWSMFPPLPGRHKKLERKQLRSERALRDFDTWLSTASPLQRVHG